MSGFSHRKLTWLLRLGYLQRFLPPILRRIIRPTLDDMARELSQPLIIPYERRLFIHCDPASGLERSILLDGNFEGELLAIFRNFVRPGSFCVDIGANIGCFTLVLADLCGPAGHVLSVEPSSRIRRRLEANLALNGLSNVTVLSCALSENSGGNATLHIPNPEEDNQGAASLFSSHLGSGTLTETVTIQSLDDVLASDSHRPCTLIKMDVEGSEMPILKGAKKLLQQDRPVLIFEYNPETWQAARTSWEECQSLLSEFGYTSFVTFEKYLLPATKESLAQATNNILAIPPRNSGARD